MISAGLHGLHAHARIPVTRRFPRPGLRYRIVTDGAGDDAVPRSFVMAAAADRHLLFGMLALQTGMINQSQLVAAFQAWTLDKARGLADYLEARGDLNSAKRAAVLDALAAVHVETHGGDVEQSLAAVPSSRSTCDSLARLGEPEIGATLARVARSKNVHGTEPDLGDAERTTTYSIGGATSDGQRFRILRPHARGGLGTVFVALDCELHREVALKQILEKHADDPDSRQRFVAEAEITARSSTPASCLSMAWARMPRDDLTTRCGSSRVTPSRRPLTGFTRTRSSRTIPDAGLWSCASCCDDSPTSATRSTTRTPAV